MARGRKPDTDEMQELKGNPSKRKARSDLLPAALGTLKPGARLNAAQLEIWNSLVPDLERMNFVRATDQQAFTRYVHTVERYWHATEQLDREGAVYWTETPHGKMRRIHPLFAIQDRLSRRLTELEDRFGLTPASRQQILLRLASVQPQLGLGGGRDGQPETIDADAPTPSPLGMLNATSVIN